MSTWNFKAGLACAALLLLGACEDGQGIGLPGGLGTGGADRKDTALSESEMAGGAFTLVPPEMRPVESVTSFGSGSSAAAATIEAISSSGLAVPKSTQECPPVPVARIL